MFSLRIYQTKTGNLCVDDEGNLVYYDFGMMDELKPNVREGFRKFCTALFAGGPTVNDRVLAQNAKKLKELNMENCTLIGEDFHFQDFEKALEENKTLNKISFTGCQVTSLSYEMNKVLDDFKAMNVAVTV